MTAQEAKEKRIIEWMEGCDLCINDEGNMSSIVIDEELDPIEVEFDRSNTIKIHTNEMEYLVFDIPTLKKMIHMIEESEFIYDHELNDEDDELVKSVVSNQKKGLEELKREQFLKVLGQ